MRPELQHFRDSLTEGYFFQHFFSSPPSKTVAKNFDTVTKTIFSSASIKKTLRKQR